MTYDEAVTEAQRLMKAGAAWAEPRERPDRPGSWYVSIGYGFGEVSTKRFADIVAAAARVAHRVRVSLK